MKILFISAILALSSLSIAKESDHTMVTPEKIKWTQGPDSLPSGVQMFVVSGNPKEAGPFVLRIKTPANYKIPPHTHPADENITVLSGEFQMGLGNKFSEKNLMRLPTGSFMQMKAGTQHFAMTKTSTVIQLHGMGPWQINYVNPADDPRRRNISQQ